MYKLYLVIVIIVISNLALCQTDHYFRGINGKALKIVDSSSLLFKYMWSDYFVDSITNEPYSGIATQWIGKYETPIDSFCVKNGVINGYKKEYLEILEPGVKPNSITYISQEKKFKVYIGYDIRIKNFDNKPLGMSIAFYSDGITHLYTIDCKKRRVKVKYKKYANGKCLEKSKYKLKSLKELDQLLINSPDYIYSKCEEIGVFRNSYWEPIIRNNCNF